VAAEWTPAIAVSHGGLHVAVRAIVLDALSKRPGDTLSRNDDFRAALGVGVGTVQRALDLLADRGALQTTARGHLGRRIEAVNPGQCWQAAGLPPIRISLSPPGSVEINSMEETLGDELVRLGVPHTVRHVRGGNRRLEQLNSGDFDLTVVSAGTFDGLVGSWTSPPAMISRQLDPGTYYAPERLLVLTTGRRPDDELVRIAIDRESFNHEALTLAQYPPRPGRQYLDVPYPEVPAHVLAGLADAGIWHVTRSAVPLGLGGLTSRPMAGTDAEATRDRLSGATIVRWAGRKELGAVLESLRLDGLAAALARQIAQENDAADRLARALRRSTTETRSD